MTPARQGDTPIRARRERGSLEASVLPEAVVIEEIWPEHLTAYDPDGQLFVNVNTPHDYDRARARVDPLGKAAPDRIMDERRFGQPDLRRGPRGSNSQLRADS